MSFANLVTAFSYPMCLGRSLTAPIVRKLAVFVQYRRACSGRSKRTSSIETSATGLLLIRRQKS